MGNLDKIQDPSIPQGDNLEMAASLLSASRREILLLVPLDANCASVSRPVC